MKVVGITGGIGSGKTTTCKIFEQLNVPVYYADIRAKELMLHNEQLRSKIIQAFGEKAYSNGHLNREYLAKVVFSSKEKLSVLNGLVHPAVGADFEAWLEEHESAKYVLKEAAILFESGAYHNVDVTVLVIAPKEVRIDRVTERDGFTRDEVLKRMNNQWTQERKAKLADHIINNDGTELLIPQVLELHRKFSS
ncbi:MAG: dephospho-CoA kinase [Flavobacteriales bacterium]|nr:dephospho-CoA kinase [Flavobacteriales bacterium]MCB9203428.1 dephospho-CoA kinase [Flavobacteriales bacterium]